MEDEFDELIARAKQTVTEGAQSAQAAGEDEFDQLIATAKNKSKGIQDAVADARARAEQLVSFGNDEPAPTREFVPEDQLGDFIRPEVTSEESLPWYRQYITEPWRQTREEYAQRGDKLAYPGEGRQFVEDLARSSLVALPGTSQAQRIGLGGITGVASGVQEAFDDDASWTDVLAKAGQRGVEGATIAAGFEALPILGGKLQKRANVRLADTALPPADRQRIATQTGPGRGAEDSLAAAGQRLRDEGVASPRGLDRLKPAGPEVLARNTQRELTAANAAREAAEDKIMNAPRPGGGTVGTADIEPQQVLDNMLGEANTLHEEAAMPSGPRAYERAGRRFTTPLSGPNEARAPLAEPYVPPEPMPPQPGTGQTELLFPQPAPFPQPLMDDAVQGELNLFRQEGPAPPPMLAREPAPVAPAATAVEQAALDFSAPAPTPAPAAPTQLELPHSGQMGLRFPEQPRPNMTSARPPTSPDQLPLDFDQSGQLDLGFPEPSPRPLGPEPAPASENLLDLSPTPVSTPAPSSGSAPYTQPVPGPEQLDLPYANTPHTGFPLELGVRRTRRAGAEASAGFHKGSGLNRGENYAQEAVKDLNRYGRELINDSFERFEDYGWVDPADVASRAAANKKFATVATVAPHLADAAHAARTTPDSRGIVRRGIDMISSPLTGINSQYAIGSGLAEIGRKGAPLTRAGQLAAHPDPTGPAVPTDKDEELDPYVKGQGLRGFDDLSNLTRNLPGLDLPFNKAEKKHPEIAQAQQAQPDAPKAVVEQKANQTLKDRLMEQWYNLTSLIP